ncbi:MAG TPA: hypothetical protein P5044_07835 [bacterium]|nr:hypothetical protein [bacterium]
MTSQEKPFMTFRNISIFAFAIAGLSLNILLVLNDMKLRGYCPYISGLPSCDLTADAFLLILLSVFIIREWLSLMLFTTGVTLGISLSAYFSLMHLLMANPSPEFYTIPTSWISLALFLFILIAKFLVIGKEKT